MFGDMVSVENCGVKFSLNFKSNRSKFYRSFNALYGRIAKANEYLIVSLVRSFCIPVVMHSLDSVNLNATSLNILDRLIVNVFSEIFKTFDKNILYNCMLYMDCWPLTYEYYNRRAKFLNELK